MFRGRKNSKSIFKSTTFLCIILVIGMLFIITKFNEMQERFNSYGDEEFKVHFIDIGQGDSIVIQTPDNEFMLIDTGEYVFKDKLDNYLQDLGVTTFKYVIFTHPHSDHIGSAAYIVNKYNIENLIMPNAVTTTKTYSNLIEAIEKKDLEITLPVIGDEYALGEAKFMIAAPISDFYDNLNNYSVAIKMVFRETSYFFGGDMEKLSENEVIAHCNDTNSDLSCDVLKVGHHGSSSSSSSAWIDLINPQIALIMCGIDNGYGHPTKETLTRLEGRNIEIARTDLEGDIVISTNGRGYTIRTQNHGVIQENETENEYSEKK